MNQKDLIDFVNDPENVKKAVEGSMEKRQAIMTSSPQRDELDEVRRKLCEVFNVFPEELEYNLSVGISLRKIEGLEALINQREQALLERVRTEVIQADEAVLYGDDEQEAGIGEADKATRNLLRHNQRLRLALLNKEENRE